MIGKRNVAARALGLLSPRVRAVLAETLPNVVEVQGHDASLRFACVNSVTYDRALTLLTKEPETIGWIEGFDDGSTLLDIGANVGVFTLFAAKRGIRVVALEPESQNYALLNRNIWLNGLDERVQALCVAASDHCGYGTLGLSRFYAGWSEHSIGTKGEFSQAVVGVTVDALLSDLHLAPAYMKIDVDGVEPSIVAGMGRTLAGSGLRSLLIEVDTASASHADMVEVICAAGFFIATKGVADQGVQNHIFRRA